jgi:cell division protein ZapA
MAEVDLSIAGRSYPVSCRDGGEDHLRSLAAHVDRKAREAAATVGGMNEVRQMLFAALLIADDYAEQAAAVPCAPADDQLATTLALLATRIEGIAESLENNG